MIIINTAQFYENDIFYRDTCTLMYFNYKTTKKIVYKKKDLPKRKLSKDDRKG